MIEEILKETKALLQGHFLLTSGKHSEYYVEKIKIINNPKYVDLLCDKLANLLKDIECDVIVGPAYGGIVLAYEVAKKLKKKFVFTQRKNEVMTIRSGFDIKAGDKAVIIEDIITTGGSVKEVIELLNSKQINIQAIGCIVDRSGGNAKFDHKLVALHTMNIETFEENECPLCKQNIPLVKPGASDKK
ncbi:MAG: orotate phosphoribosyltransferase [Candidatus Cloacimonetes bacterium]|jgi:orotate phosphoribosyltransferase|nr:orotate phosphoribosyltransferase [Candidatus Cloacimonadota bacterium]MDD4155266.1 orotate phosphoribosyltransferase [Candidatus Cloacimonadota bacterium]